MYATGNGVAKDLDKAVGLFRLAAEKGYDKAIVKLGLCYRDGFGVIKMCWRQ